MKPDSNVAHRDRESDARDGNGFWFSTLAVVGFIFSGRRLVVSFVPKDVLRHQSGRRKAGGRVRNNNADNKENDFTPRLLASSGFAAPYHNPFLACLVTWNMELFRLEPFKEGQANSCLDQSVDHRTKQHQA